MEHQPPPLEAPSEIFTTDPNSKFPLTPEEIEHLCKTASDLFLSEPALLSLSSPIKIVGALHGQYPDLLKILEYGGEPPNTNYLFLGGIVNRGKQSLETFCHLLMLKIKYPNNVWILRGKDECMCIARIYGFYNECKRRSNFKAFKKICQCFDTIPVAAILEDTYFCVYGGISPDLQTMDQIQEIIRPTDVPDAGLLCDLLWSDPDKELIGWNDIEGVSYHFGSDVLRDFLNQDKHWRDDLKKSRITKVIRGRTVQEKGYEIFDGGNLITIFSAPNYCGEFGNDGAFMTVEEDLSFSFTSIDPANLKQTFSYEFEEGEYVVKTL